MTGRRGFLALGHTSDFVESHDSKGTIKGYGVGE